MLADIEILAVENRAMASDCCFQDQSVEPGNLVGCCQFVGIKHKGRIGLHNFKTRKRLQGFTSFRGGDKRL